MPLSGRGHLARERRLIDEPAHRVRDRFGVLRRHQHAADPVDHGFLVAADARGHDGNAGRERFEDGDGHPLDVR